MLAENVNYGTGQITFFLQICYYICAFLQIFDYIYAFVVAGKKDA